MSLIPVDLTAIAPEIILVVGASLLLLDRGVSAGAARSPIRLGLGGADVGHRRAGGRASVQRLLTLEL